MSNAILVVDDEEILIKTMRKLLEKNKYIVYTAKNANDAKVILEELDINLIICDIRMPGKNGVEFIKESEGIITTRKIPYIFVTGFADPMIENVARSLNPIAYIMKPFNAKDILDNINSVLLE